jgi:hypothetical protein
MTLFVPSKELHAPNHDRDAFVIEFDFEELHHGSLRARHNGIHLEIAQRNELKRLPLQEQVLVVGLKP